MDFDRTVQDGSSTECIRIPVGVDRASVGEHNTGGDVRIDRLLRGAHFESARWRTDQRIDSDFGVDGRIESHRAVDPNRVELFGNHPVNGKRHAGRDVDVGSVGRKLTVVPNVGVRPIAACDYRVRSVRRLS